MKKQLAYKLRLPLLAMVMALSLTMGACDWNEREDNGVGIGEDAGDRDGNEGDDDDD